MNEAPWRNLRTMQAMRDCNWVTTLEMEWKKRHDFFRLAINCILKNRFCMERMP